MINLLLAIHFILYIVSLTIGFRIAKHKKDSHNKKYHKFKPVLFYLLSLSFVFSSFVMAKTALQVPFMTYLTLINIAFIIYFFSYYPKETRCWKQHRMLIYHFILIPILYYCSLVLEEPGYNYYVLIIFIYNVLEFQFAKFNLKQFKMWD